MVSGRAAMGVALFIIYLPAAIGTTFTAHYQTFIKTIIRAFERDAHRLLRLNGAITWKYPVLTKS
jgi:hypothetical protein